MRIENIRTLEQGTLQHISFEQKTLEHRTL